LKRPALVLTAEEKESLDQLRQSRTAAMRDVQRAQILWRYQSGETVAQIARAVNTTRNSALKWIDRALQVGVMTGIRDTPHKPREAVITDDARAWVVHLACAKPKDLGYAAELWTRSALAGHVRREAGAAGFPALARAGKATIQRILAAQEIQPHKVRYYLERRDPDFESKMRMVLLIYREVATENEAAAHNGGLRDVVTVSVERNRACRRPRTQPRTCRPFPAGILHSPAIMSTCAMERCRFWRASTCSTATSPHASKSGTGVLSSSVC
jgi:hypothetical protein